MKITTPKILFYLSLIIIQLLSSCGKNINQIPKILLIDSVDGLKVDITGLAKEPNGVITDVMIFWGDDNSDQLKSEDSTSFLGSHIYSSEGTYNISVVITNINNIKTSKNIVVNLYYNKASLKNISPNLYKKSDDEYLILTLNLNTYQEDRQIEKLYLIADFIVKMDIDFVCFQECAQNKDSSIASGIIRDDNMALIIANRLNQKYLKSYNLVWNWVHYVSNIYEEGEAILSKYPFTDSEHRYISSSGHNSTSDTSSRKAIYASYQIPQGILNLFSFQTNTRISLTDMEQLFEINKLKEMSDDKSTLHPTAKTIICGDLNSNPTSEDPWSNGYKDMMIDNDYWDSFLEIFPNANVIPAESQYYTVWGALPGRIDYIFVKKDASVQIMDSQIIFTNDVIGKVSDHYGVITKIKILN